MTDVYTLQPKIYEASHVANAYKKHEVTRIKILSFEFVGQNVHRTLSKSLSTKVERASRTFEIQQPEYVAVGLANGCEAGMEVYTKPNLASFFNNFPETMGEHCGWLAPHAVFGMLLSKKRVVYRMRDGQAYRTIERPGRPPKEVAVRVVPKNVALGQYVYCAG